jgi:polysaccharide export outer membrane protein
MLAVSEGLMPYASKQAYIYRREATTGAKNEIPIELRKIMDRKAPDVPLQQNDILYIPDNTGRRAGFSALEKIIAFGAATASGVLIYGSVR